MPSPILMTLTDGVMTLTMNRPDKKNALTDEMYGLLADHLAAAAADRAVRVVVVRGEGDLFTAGNDIGDFAAARPGEGLRNVVRFIDALVTAPKPLVAAVQGKAVGVGMTMLLHCDYVILADDAALVTPFVNLGLVPEAASSLLLPERIGHARAFAMLAMGQPVGAAQALAWGLANEVVARSELIATAETTAQRLARQPLDAVIATKALLRRQPEMAERVAIETELFAKHMLSAEAHEAFAAFAERRAPDFARLG